MSRTLNEALLGYRQAHSQRLDNIYVRGAEILANKYIKQMKIHFEYKLISDNS